MRLEARGIARAFGATKALRGVSLEVAKGEVHALVGENGAGKSTLLQILAGAITADEGTISLDGERYAPRDPTDARKLGVAIVHQELSLCPHLSVAANVVLGTEPSRFGVLLHDEAVKRARAALDELSAPLDVDTIVADLGPAERQLVEIARALALPSCRLLILDEPTSSLGQTDAKRLLSLVRKLRDRGTSVLYVSHFLEEVIEVADRYTVLRDGEVTGHGDARGTTPNALVAKMAGREKEEDVFARSPHEAGEVIVAAAGLASIPKPISASFELRRGEVLGIAGLVGAGRTELLRAIFGLAPIASGTIRVGIVTGPRTPRERLREGVGMVSEDRKGEGLALGMSIADNMTLSKLDFGRFGFVDRKKQEAAAARWIEKLAIRARAADQPVIELSGGNQQKVAIARLLRHDVDVFLLDEPTRGIDIGSKTQIYKLIDELARKGKAVLLVSSHLPELLGTCDRIAVMARGRLGEARETAAWTEESLLAEATAA